MVFLNLCSCFSEPVFPYIEFRNNLHFCFLSLISTKLELYNRYLSCVYFNYLLYFHFRLYLLFYEVYACKRKSVKFFICYFYLELDIFFKELYIFVHVDYFHLHFEETFVEIMSDFQSALCLKDNLQIAVEIKYFLMPLD